MDALGRDAVGQQPSRRAAKRHAVPHATPRGVVAHPHPVHLGVRHDARHVVDAGRVGDQRLCVEGREESLAGAGQVRDEVAAEAAVHERPHVAGRRVGRGEAPPRPQPRDRRDLVEEESGDSPDERKFRPAREPSLDFVHAPERVAVPRVGERRDVGAAHRGPEFLGQRRGGTQVPVAHRDGGEAHGRRHTIARGRARGKGSIERGARVRHFGGTGAASSPAPRRPARRRARRGGRDHVRLRDPHDVFRRDLREFLEVAAGEVEAEAVALEHQEQHREVVRRLAGRHHRTAQRRLGARELLGRGRPREHPLELDVHLLQRHGPVLRLRAREDAQRAGADARRCP